MQEPAGSWDPCAEPLAHFFSWEGGQEEIQEYGSVLRAPSRSSTLIALGAAGNVALATFPQVTCAEVTPVVPLWAPCDLVSWCLTFSEEIHVGSGGACIP